MRSARLATEDVPGMAEAPEGRHPGSALLPTAAALTGFAANSLLCRAALATDTIDPWSFTAVRLASGALTLFLLSRAAARGRPRARSGSWASALALFGYAAAFSLAYVRVGAGVGALTLFASVQATMIGWSAFRGQRPRAIEWLGLGIAMGGLVLLTRPGAVAPDPLGVGLMAIAGIAWGAYSLRGRRAVSPLAATADNFVRSVSFALLGLAIGAANVHFSARGVVLACASGAVASGLGYSLWYLALPRISATQAAMVQLVVPVLAAVAGILILGEPASARLAVSGALILGGVGMAVAPRRSGRRVAGPQAAAERGPVETP